MNVVIIGNIGWQYLYHLGDEAMTEAAIDMLRNRGVSDITLVASEPPIAEAFYGLPSVSRIGFSRGWSRRGNDGHLKKVTIALADNTYDEGTVYSAIRDCDVVLIAGGGNMNTRDYHLLYERLATKRIAEHFGKPLYVSSQTVGPMLSPEDRELVVEIADYALGFGCRETTTAALLQEHVAYPERIHLTLDDAIVLAADDSAYKAVDELAGDGPFVVASFTDHHGTIWRDNASYYQDIAHACRTIAEYNNVDVVLAPHAGSLDSGETSRDQHSNDAIARLANSDRVRATRMITAREDVALIEKAALSLSTRYHPTVFGPAVATPTIGIAPSYYSSVRMRGSMSQVGLERFVLPTSSMHLVPDAAAEAIAQDTALTTFLNGSRDRASSFQHAWWDALAEAMRSAVEVVFDRSLATPHYEPQGEWSSVNQTIFPVFDDYAQAVDLSRALARTLADERMEHERVAGQLASTRDALTRLRGHKVVRAAAWVGRKLPRR